MPVAAMHKNHLPAATENNVRRARKFPDVDAIAVAQLMKQSTDKHFRPGIAGAHGSHDLASLLGSSRVDHFLHIGLLLVDGHADNSRRGRARRKPDP